MNDIWQELPLQYKPLMDILVGASKDSVELAFLGDVMKEYLAERDTPITEIVMDPVKNEQFLNHVLDKLEEYRQPPKTHAGVDAWFTASFITYDMSNSFKQITEAFLENEPLLKARKKVRVVYPFWLTVSSSEDYEFKVLSTMVACAREGSEYSKALLLNLYKAFFKPEYNMLKKFRILRMEDFYPILRETLSKNLPEDAPQFLENPQEVSETVKNRVYTQRMFLTARLTLMCTLMGIEMDPSFYLEVKKLESNYSSNVNSFLDKLDEEEEKLDSTAQSKKERRVEDWLMDNFPDLLEIPLDPNLVTQEEKDRCHVLFDALKLTTDAFSANCQNYRPYLNLREFDFLLHATTGLVLKGGRKYRKRENLDVILLLSYIAFLAEQFSDTVDVKEREARDLMPSLILDYDEADDYDEITSRVNSTLGDELKRRNERIQKILDSSLAEGQKQQNQQKAKLERQSRQTANQSTSKASTKASTSHKRIEELEETIRRLNAENVRLKEQLQKERDKIQVQRSLYESAREDLRQQQERAELSAEERGELLMLRDYVDRVLLNQEGQESEGASFEQMKAYLLHKKGLIIGGHPGWVRKVRSELPTWTVIPAEEGPNPDVGIDSADMVFFFFEHLGHPMFDKYTKAATAKNKPYSFIRGTNINQLIPYLYQTMRAVAGKGEAG